MTHTPSAGKSKTKSTPDTPRLPFLSFCWKTEETSNERTSMGRPKKPKKYNPDDHFFVHPGSIYASLARPVEPELQELVDRALAGKRPNRKPSGPRRKR